MKYLLPILLLIFPGTLLTAQVSAIPINGLSPNTPCFAISPNSDMWVMLQHKSMNQLNARLALYRFDANMQWLWSADLEDRFLNSFRIITLPTGALVIAAVEVMSGQTAIALMEINPDGTLHYCQRLSFPYLSLYLNGLVNAPDGYLVTVCEKTAPTRIHLLKFKFDGTMQWEKSFFGNLTGAEAVIDNAGNVYQLITASGIGIGSARYPKLLKLNNKGTLVKAWAIHGGYEPELYSICLTSDHHLVLAGRTAINNDEYPDYWIVKMDTSAQIEWSYNLANQGSDKAYSYYYQLVPDQNGGVYWQLYRSFQNSEPSGLFHFNTAGQLQWGKGLPDSKALFDLTIQAKALYSLGYANKGNGNFDLLIYKMTEAGQLPSCCGDTIVLIPTQRPAFVEPITFQSGNGVSIESTSIVLTSFISGIEIRCQPFDIMLDPSIICPSECVQAKLISANADSLSVEWSFPLGEPAISAGIQPDPVCYEIPGHYAVEALVKTENNCIFTVEDSISVCVPDIIPNAFTPNGDQINDYFGPVLYFPVIDYSFEIYNRWGQPIFRSFDSISTWDGQFNNQPAPADVYVWTLRYTIIRDGLPEEKRKTGEVTLLR